MSTNHKRIGRLYLFVGVLGGIIGSSFSGLIRFELGFVGQLLGDGQLYNVVIRAHAFLMIFFLIIPILIGRFGN